jgi:hypothetical protein
VTRLGNGHERLNSMNERLDSNIPTCEYVYTRMEACLNPLSVNHLHTLIAYTISVQTIEPNLPHCEVSANLHAHICKTVICLHLQGEATKVQKKEVCINAAYLKVYRVGICV